MPNWCSIKIIISGKSLSKFKKTLENENFCFQQTVPILSNQSIWGGVKEWGTKWDVADAKVKIFDTSIEILTETAWSPPLKWAENCRNKFVSLDIEIGYCEVGMEYYGVWKNGVDQCFNFACGECRYDKKIDNYILGGNLKKHIEKYGIGLGG